MSSAHQAGSAGRSAPADEVATQPVDQSAERVPTDRTRLREVVEQVVSRAGYDLEDLTVVAAGRRRLLRVIIDSDSGVDLDVAAAVSRDISARLDELDAADPMGSAAYTLEVTSPGIGRPLTLPRHFRRAAGRLLALTTSDGKSFPGRVRGAGDDGVDLLVGPGGERQQFLRYDEIAQARVEVEFGTPSARVLALLGQRTAQKFRPDALVDLEEHGDLDDEGDGDHDGADHDGDDHDDDRDAPGTEIDDDER